MRFWAFFVSLVVLLSALSLPVAAQDQAWLQVEALPDLATAEDRARAYSALFPETEGYQIGTWYAIALGPMTRDEAGQKLLRLRAENLIPADSYIADGTAYGRRFWPQGVVDPVAARRPVLERHAPRQIEKIGMVGAQRQLAWRCVPGHDRPTLPRAS